MILIEKDEDNGYFMLVDDGIGLAKSKSRNVLVRIRDALNAVRETGLVGLTVRTRPPGLTGVVLALSRRGLVVRLLDGALGDWPIEQCQIIEPERPTTPTPWNDPAIGILPAVELLKRALHLENLENLTGRDPSQLAIDITEFLEARRAAEPT